ncbi:MAG: alkaline phosphatase PhoX [Microthrixaceae bacterium]
MAFRPRRSVSGDRPTRRPARGAARLLGVGAAGLLAAACTMPPATPQGSSSRTPYLVPTAADVSSVAILSTGDSVNPKPDGTPYRLTGIPDGLGAYDNGDGTFTVLMNHEHNNTQGVTRAHGAKGSYVSKWIVEKDTLKVRSGADLIQGIATWNTTTGTWNAPAAGVVLNRLCSGDLPAASALFDGASGLGTTEKIFFSGEESGAEGRGFAHVVTGAAAGTSYELPHLGNFSFENIVLRPDSGTTTIAAGLDDTTPGEVYFYKGTKTSDANPVVAAGLANGVLGGIAVQGLAAETDTNAPVGAVPFTLPDLGDVSGLTGAQLQTASTAAGITKFNRPEDGAWDPSNPNVFYFVTTASFTSISRLWRLTFVDGANPSLGGTAEVMYESPANDPSLAPADQAGPRMMDNITVTPSGDVLIQEDPGNQPYVAGIWQYDPGTDQIRKVLVHDPARFAVGAPGFVTQDEESSGIIPLQDITGANNYLVDVQSHATSSDPELVEDGQLLSVNIPPFG